MILSFRLPLLEKRDGTGAEKTDGQIKDEYIGVVGTTFGFNVPANAGRKFVEGFLSGKYDEVYIIYAEFLSRGKQVPALKQLSPDTTD